MKENMNEFNIFYQNKNYRLLANIELAIFSYNCTKEDIINKKGIKDIVCSVKELNK